MPVLINNSTESLGVAHLDEDLRLIGLRIHPGTAPDHLPIPVRDVMVDALALKSSHLIIAHNHPEGDPTPSRDDLLATRRLAQVLRAIELRLVDHLVLARSGWTSFRELGLI